MHSNSDDPESGFNTTFTSELNRNNENFTENLTMHETEHAEQTDPRSPFEGVH